MIVEQIPTAIGMPPEDAPRSPGIHLSKIIRNIAVENKALDAKWVEDFSLVEVDDGGVWWNSLDPASQLRMSIGMAWEAWYLQTLSHVAPKPGELCIDGIYGTPDGESLDMVATAHGTKPVLCLHEIKTTSKSTNTVANLETQWLWLAQTKGYCKGMGTLVAYLHVLFLCGDYSYPITPQLKVFKITFTQMEIDDHWEMILSYVRHYQRMEREEMMKDTV